MGKKNREMEVFSYPLASGQTRIHHRVAFNSSLTLQSEVGERRKKRNKDGKKERKKEEREKH